MPETSTDPLGSDERIAEAGRWTWDPRPHRIPVSTQRERLQAVILDEIGVAVHATDLSRKILTWNAGAERLFGWTAGEALGRHSEELVTSPQSPIADVVRRGVEDGPWEGELILAHKSGSTFPAYVRTRLVRGSAPDTTAIVVVTLDITERLRSERALKLAQDHMRALTDSIGEGMFSLDDGGRVTYMNPVAERTLGLHLEDVRDKVMHDLVHFRRSDGSPFPVADCPIMHAGRDGEVKRVEDDVFVRADGTSLPVAYTASPIAGDEGSEGCVVIFSDITRRHAESRRVEREIEKLGRLKRVRDALDEDRFVLYAQPIIRLADETVVQRELLIRMLDGDGGVIPPGEFLPVAEEYGLMAEIDRWVIDRGAQIAAGGLPVELNVSAASIGDPELIPHIALAFARAGTDPSTVVFEITETALLADHAEGRRFVEWLHEFGCGVALDDFGTGYGGFTYLKQLPIDFLKIDVEFVRDLAQNPASRNVVETIVHMAERFDVQTVAEGVEDAGTLTMLGEMGVHWAQGYHIGRPAPLETTC